LAIGLLLQHPAVVEAFCLSRCHMSDRAHG
jgi:hypothetical protein